MVVVAVFLALVAQTNSDTPARLIRDAFWVAALFLATRAGVAGDRVFPGLAVGKFVVWSALFATAYTGAILLVGQVLSIPVDTEITLQGARMGAMQGAGIGLGYELSTLLGARIWNTRAEL